MKPVKHANQSNQTVAVTSLPKGLDGETDARLRLAAAHLIDSFLENDSMKDNEH